tara:strand:- start:33804 stop:34880 length:1077 start_codon:yes stop_codon:yes gene_type:complete
LVFREQKIGSKNKNIILSNPVITVLMSVYNGERYIQESIESILTQTYENFEFIIIDDGSKDKTKELIRSYDDKRIKFFVNKKNIGLTKSLNIGLKFSKGKYIARMDADDISLPDRLEKQVNYMNINKDIDICGSWAKTIGENFGEIRKYPVNHDEIKCNLLFNNIMCHSSVMMREKIFSDGKVKYDPSILYAQDFEFFARLINTYIFANIPEVLIHYRIHENQIAEKKKKEQSLIANTIITRQLNKINIKPTNKELSLHRNIIELRKEESKKLILETEGWLLKVIDGNDRTNYYDREKIRIFINKIWLKLCNGYAGLGIWILKTYYFSKLNTYILNDYRFVKFIIKSIIKWKRLKKII